MAKRTIAEWKAMVRAAQQKVDDAAFDLDLAMADVADAHASLGIARQAVESHKRSLQKARRRVAREGGEN